MKKAVTLSFFLLILFPLISQTGPGGVGTTDGTSTLETWFRGDIGTSTTTNGAANTTWSDQSGNSVNCAVAVGRTTPTFVSSSANGYPAINFDGVNNQYEFTRVIQNDYTIICVFNNAGPNFNQVGGNWYDGHGLVDGEVGGSTNDFGLSLQADKIRAGGGTPDFTAQISGYGDGNPHLALLLRNETSGLLNVYGDESNSFINGATGAQTAPTRLTIGSLQTDNLFYTGEICEVATYSTELNAAERIIVSNYLSAKYGFTLNANDTYIQDNPGNGDYDHDVAGMGRVDATNLHTDAQGTGMIRIWNPSGLGNNEFLMWGHDNGSLTVAVNSDVPTGLNARISRIWRINERNAAGTFSVDVGNVDFRIDLAGITINSPQLLVDTDNDGSFADESPIAMTNVSGSIWEVTSSNAFVHDRRFTIGTSLIAPGAVAENLQVWYKADAGITGGSNVSQWDDQSLNGNHAIQSTGTAQPAFVNNLFNFNPGIDFDGSSDRLPVSNLNYATAGVLSQIHVFTVFSTGFSGSTYADNWAFLDYDRSDYFDFYVRADNGALGFSYEATGVRDNTATTTGLNDNTPYMGMAMYNSALTNDTEMKVNGRSDYSADIEGGGINVGTGVTRFGYVGDGSEAPSFNGGGNDYFYEGEIGELIYYENLNMTATQILKVESYLALKYGITLDQSTAQDYLASDGVTEMWDKDAANASTYDNDITGIGRDDNSELGQVKSMSVNSDAIVLLEAIGEGSNSSPSWTDIADMEFLTFGNNNGTASWTLTGAPSGFELLNRQWLVQETGNVGTVQLDFDVANSNFDLPATSDGGGYYFIYDANSNGDLSDETPTAMADQGGDIWRTTVDFSTGMLFTVSGVAGFIASPGGVSPDLTLWLKADSGVTGGAAVTQWDDQSGNNRDVSQTTASLRPDGTANQLNFNPVLTFDGTDDFLDRSGDQFNDYIDINSGSNSTGTGSIFSVTELSGTGIIINQWSGSSNYVFVQEKSPDGITGGGAFRSGSAAGATTVVADNTPILLTTAGTTGANNFDQYVNGGNLSTGTTVANSIGSGTHDLSIGQNTSGAGQVNGDIGEVIVYSAKLNSAGINRVESYLAIKYGITLNQTSAQDYTASNGTTEMWDKDATGAGTYNNDIFGIGRDDTSALGQVKSQSVNDDAIIIIEAEGEGSNAFPVFVDIQDLEFLTFGNNDGTASWTSTGAPVGFELLNRQWLVQETGDVGTVQLDFDVANGNFDLPATSDGGGYYFIYDANSNGDLSDETPTAMADQGGDIWRTTVDFSTGMVFTVSGFGFIATPGGVSPDLTLWLKADSGVTGGAAVSQWDDQSSTGRDVAQGTEARQPELSNNTINFNPVIRFTPTGIYGTANADYLTLQDAAGTNIDFTNARIYVVGRKTHSNQCFAERTGSGTNTDPQQRGIAVLAAGTTFDLFDTWIENGGITPVAGGTLDEPRIFRGTAPFSVTDGLDIGHGDNAFRNLDGDIAEFVIYGEAVTATEESRIESYLALKYGITLDQTTAQDYLASNGTTEMWDKDAANASAYNNDIFGIGRDDTSALGQVKSQSVNGDAIVIIEAEGEGSNSSPSFTDIGDLEFLTAGNNGGAASWTMTGAPANLQILSRQWSVQETGDVGTVQLDFDMANNNFNVPELMVGSIYYFIYDSDNDGGLSDETPLTMTDQGGNIWRVTGIDFDNGMEFTVAGSATAPGGVGTDLNLWLKADSGVTGGASITQWDDQSSQFQHMDNLFSGTSPSLETDEMNFNPAVDFSTATTQRIGRSNMTFPTTEITTFTVVNRAATSRSEGFLSYAASSSTNAWLLWNYGSGAGLSQRVNNILVSPGQQLADGIPHIHSSDFSDAADQLNAFVDGGAAGGNPFSTVTTAITSDGTLVLAEDQDAIGGGFQAAQHFLGSISETVVYSSLLSAVQRNRVESYLALKYGITIDQTTAQDYTASDGTTEMWDKDAANASTYNNDIFGIGRDDTSALGQVKSQSANNDAVVIFEAEGEGTNSFPVFVDMGNREFLTFGNNDGSATWTMTGAPLNFSLLQRQWGVQETGETGTIQIDMNVANGNFDVPAIVAGAVYYFIYDTDSDGSLADEVPGPMTDQGSDVWRISGINLNDGMIFSFATIGTAPGNTASHLNLWLKADSGISVAVSDVTGWLDQSGSINDVVSVTGTPAYNTVNMNFNPSVSFDGSTEFMTIPQTMISSGDNAYDVYVIARATGTDDGLLHAMLTFGTAPGTGNAMALGINHWSTLDHAIWHNWYNKAFNSASNSIVNNEPSLINYNYDLSRRLTAANGFDFPVSTDLGLTLDVTADHFIGKGWDNNFHWDGEIAEIIVYDTSYGSNSRLRIESYLAIKYGITLDNSGGGTEGDYISTDNTLIWDASANNYYHNDVFGIGRDDVTALGQVKSQSINDDAVVIIEAEGEGSNSSPSFTDIQDLEFLMAGNNDGGAVWTLTGAPNNFQRTGRIWQVQETGETGTVGIDFDVANSNFDLPALVTGTNYYFLYDSDNDGLLTDEVPDTMTDQGSDVWRITGIDLDEEMIFTLATLNTAPGNVSKGLTLWLKADTSVTGVASVTQWGDHSPYRQDLDEMFSGTSPSVQASDMNYNPAVDFSGSTSDRIGRSNMVFPTSQTTFFEVLKRDANTRNEALFSYNTPGTDNAWTPFRHAVTGKIHQLVNDIWYDSDWTFDNNEPRLYTSNFSTVTDEVNQYLDGKTTSGNPFTQTSGNVATNGTLLLGEDQETPGGDFEASQAFLGTISEVMVYDGVLTGEEQNRVESYLALKYGITLDNSAGGITGDYTASDGTLVWDASDNAGYHNGVIGLCRDDIGAFIQKQSHNLNDSTRIFVGTLASTNKTNTSIISTDISYLVIGHNGGYMKASLPSTEKPPGIYSRINREWKVTNTNFSNDFSLEIELSTTTPVDLSHLRLLVDDDGDFTDATIVNTPDVGFAFGSIIISGIGWAEIPINSTRYITLASTNEATPLPVDLLSFTATVIDQRSVYLDWETTMEINNDYFTVERSDDGQDWEELIEMDGAGNSLQPLSYGSIDYNPYSGTSYYRLKQTDFNGQYTYSTIRPVEIMLGEPSQIRIYPNPTQGYITIEGLKDEFDRILYFNMLGQNVSLSVRQIDKGEDWLRIDISHLPSGMYTIKTRTSAQKVYKQ